MRTEGFPHLAKVPQHSDATLGTRQVLGTHSYTAFTSSSCGAGGVAAGLPFSEISLHALP